MTQEVVVPIVAAAAALSLIFRKVPKYLVNLAKGNIKTSDKKDTAVVVVGMQNSSKYGKCPGAQVDSTAMGSLLSKHGSVTLLQDKAATVSAVVSALQQAVKKDLCIFYYSGHGGQERNSKGEGGMSEFLCLNNGPLHDYDIWKIISTSAGRVVMVFDCCHSATMFRHVGMEGEFKGIRHLHKDEIEPMYPGFEFSMLKNMATASAGEYNVLVWSGCPANDYSYGGNDGGVLTTGIRRAYHSSATYDEVWKSASKYAKGQNPVRTVLGTGFGGRVFK